MWMRHEETIHLGDLESGAVKEPYREFQYQNQDPKEWTQRMEQESFQ